MTSQFPSKASAFSLDRALVWRAEQERKLRTMSDLARLTALNYLWGMVRSAAMIGDTYSPTDLAGWLDIAIARGEQVDQQ